MTDEHTVPTDEAWAALDNEIAGLPSVEAAQAGDIHEQGESEEQGGTDSREGDAEGGTASADLDPDGGPDDGDRPELGADSEDNAEVDYNMEIEVPMPYGMEKMTVGQLKDEVSNVHIRQQKLDKQSNEMMVERQELETIASMIGPNLPPEAHQALQQRRQAVLAREGEHMLQAIPEWKEEVTFNADRKEMQTMATEYGFSEHEFQTVSDHRLVKLLRDHTKLKARVEKAGKEIRPDKRKPTKPGRKPRETTAQQSQSKLIAAAKESDNPDVKLAAIDSLIR